MQTSDPHNQKKIDSMMINHDKIKFFSNLIENVDTTESDKTSATAVDNVPFSLIELRNFLINLVCLPAIKNYLQTAYNNTREERIQNEKNFILVTQYTLSKIDIWEFSQNENLTISRLHNVLNLFSVKNRIEIRKEVGQSVHEQGIETLSLFTDLDVDSNTIIGLRINPNTIKRILLLIVSCNHSFLDIKFMSRFGLLDKSNSKALIALYSDLFRCLRIKITQNLSSNAFIVHFPLPEGKVGGPQIVQIETSRLTDHLKFLGFDFLLEDLRHLDHIINNDPDVTPSSKAPINLFSYFNG